MKMTDVYAGWRARLANAALPKSEQKKIPTFETEVDPGFYRKRLTEKTAGGATKTVGHEPVAFWLESGAIVGVAGGRNLDAEQCVALWHSVSASPISEETWRAVAERGEPWPDAHVPKFPTAEMEEALRAEALARSKVDPTKALDGAPVGSALKIVLPPEQAAAIREEMAKPGTALKAIAELPGVAGPASSPDAASDDPAKFIAAEIEALKGGVPQYATIESDEQSARAQDLRSQLTTAAGKLDKHREALVRPHLDAQQKINAQFNPTIKATKELANTVLDAMRAWERTKREAAAEALRRAEEERQRIIAANEAAARKAAEEGKPAPEAAPAVVQAQSNAPPPSEQIKGATGRAASVRTAWLAVVDDQDAAYLAMRANPVVIEAIRKVAQARLDAGIDTPGVSKKEDVKIR